METCVTSAFAKLNLTLDVLGQRPDGYHDLKMVMQTVALCDRLTLTFGGSGLSVSTNLKFLPADEKNLAAQAALRFWEQTGIAQEPLSIQVEKRIPVCAGLAGGSSDAAAVLQALNCRYRAPLDETELRALGASVGSDVPYCLMGGTALAEGRGETLTRLAPLPDCLIVLCKPNYSISTPELFGRIRCGRIRCRPDTNGVIAALEAGDLPGVARRLYNVFEDVLPERCAAAVREIKIKLIECGALGAAMSGTGPAVFGLFDDEARAREACEALSIRYPDTFFTRPV